MMQSTLNTQNELPNAGPGTNRQHDFLPKPESELETNSALAVLSWNELQSCFSVAMEQRSQAEMLLQQETAEILEVCTFLPIFYIHSTRMWYFLSHTDSGKYGLGAKIFISWSQTIAAHDEGRAFKRSV